MGALETHPASFGHSRAITPTNRIVRVWYRGGRRPLVFCQFWPILAGIGPIVGQFFLHFLSAHVRASKTVKKLALHLQSAQLWVSFGEFSGIFGHFWPILAIFGRFLANFWLISLLFLSALCEIIPKLSKSWRHVFNRPSYGPKRPFSAIFGRFWSILADFGGFLADFWPIFLQFLRALCESITKL